MNQAIGTPRVRALVPLDLEEQFDAGDLLAAAASVARGSGATLEVVVLGRAPGEETARDALRMGAATVWLARHGGLASPVPAEQAAEAFAEALLTPELRAPGEPTVSLLPACAAGEELAARLAVRLYGAALGRCTNVELTASGLVVTRAAFGARAQARLRCEVQGYGVMRMGQAGIDPVPAPQGEMRSLTLDAALPALATTIRTATSGGQRRLEGARLVVSGGRGIGGPEGFAQLQSLADALGGALGGSLPAVDAGWVQVARQVGQSGKFVTPELYVAVGISGTPQHLAGIGSRTRIVAVNKDPEADIFRVAEVGCVGDWNEIVPPLLARLRTP